VSEVELRVIGSGFGRTGTTSMKAALELLGFGRCYHMQEVFKRPSHARSWGRWRPGTPQDVDRLFAGFGAAVDFPASLIYPQLLHRFPDAKVVHTVRDADRWYDSTAETIYRARDVFRSAPLRFLPPVRDLYEMLDAVVWDGLFDGRFEDRHHAIGVYEQWIVDVRRTVPADRLLVFDVADGWGPLCDFLGVPVPHRPFPRVNDKDVFQRRLAAIRLASRALPAAAAAGLALAARQADTARSSRPPQSRVGTPPAAADR
jgi:hypothetical protein